MDTRQQCIYWQTFLIVVPILRIAEELKEGGGGVEGGGVEGRLLRIQQVNLWWKDDRTGYTSSYITIILDEGKQLNIISHISHRSSDTKHVQNFCAYHVTETYTK